MRIALVFVVAALLTGFAGDSTERKSVDDARAAADPIERLVARLSASPLWQNGRVPILDLPATASIDEVITRFFQTISFDDGRVTDYRVLETREVRIRGSLPDRYTAVLVDTDLGRKIVLLKHQGYPLGWGSRVYDAD